MKQYDSERGKTWGVRQRVDDSMQGEMQQNTKKGEEKNDRNKLKGSSRQRQVACNARDHSHRYVHNTTGYHRIGITGRSAAGEGDNLAFASSFCEDARTSTIALFCWQIVSSSLPPHRRVPPSGGVSSSASVSGESVPSPFGRSNSSSCWCSSFPGPWRWYTWLRDFDRTCEGGGVPFPLASRRLLIRGGESGRGRACEVKYWLENGG